MKKKYVRKAATNLAATFALIGCASVASAAAPGFYMAGTVGYSSADVDSSYQEDLDDIVISMWDFVGLDVVDGDSDLDKSDVGFDIALGYQVSAYFALEAGYFDLGKLRYEAEGTVTDGVDLYDATTGVNMGIKGPSVSAIGIWPVNDRVSVDFRAGALFAKLKATVHASIDGESASDSESESGTSLLLGTGVSFALSERMALRVGYTRVSGGELEGAKINRFSAGLRVAF